MTAMYYRDSDIWRTARDMTPTPARADAIKDDSLALRIPGCRVRHKISGIAGYLVLMDGDREDGVLVRSEQEGAWVWQGTEVEYISAWQRH